MTECTHKTLLGRPACRFEPRYDVKRETPMHAWITGIPYREMRAMHETAAAKETYVRDVCTRCGKTIERQSKESV